MTDWAKEKEQKRLDRMQKSLQRALAAPPARGEVLSGLSTLQQHVASVAVAIEALENCLVRAKILGDGDVLREVEALLKSKSESVAAQEAAEGEGMVKLAS